MSVVVVGMNQRSVPLDMFERMTIGDDYVLKVLDDLIASPDINEAVVLSTCNRTEIYVKAERFHPADSEIREVLSRHSGLPAASFADQLYSYNDEHAARHLFAVTCGLDSAVLGESEILGQVRRAYEVSEGAGSVGTDLTDLFAASCTAGRKARSSTGIARNVTSVSRAAVAMAIDQLGSLEGRSICVLGAGEMSEGMTVSLRDAGARKIVICNRTVERARSLAERVGGSVVALSELETATAGVDVLLTGTGASSLMIDNDALQRVMAARPDRALLIVDIAVPRDVDPVAGEIDGVTLLDMADLTAFAEVGRAERRNEIAAVQALIDDEVKRFQSVQVSRAVEPLLAAFRSDVEALRLKELNRLPGDVDSAARAQIDAATKSILNKLLHRPTSELRNSAGTVRGDRNAQALSELFEINLDEL